MNVLNLSLSTGEPVVRPALHDLVDDAYFQNTVLVCAANNVPGASVLFNSRCSRQAEQASSENPE